MSSWNDSQQPRKPPPERPGAGKRPTLPRQIPAIPDDHPRPAPANDATETNHEQTSPESGGETALDETTPPVGQRAAQAAQRASKVGSDIVRGAKWGSRAGGVGAAAGAVAGAGKALLQSKHRNKALGIVAAILAPFLLLHLSMLLTVGSVAALVGREIDNTASHRAREAGVQPERLVAYTDAATRTGVGWSVLAAIEQDPGSGGAGPFGILVDDYNDMAAVAGLDPVTDRTAENHRDATNAVGRMFVHLLTSHDPALDSRSLIAGAVSLEVDGKRRLDIDTDNPDRAAAHERVKKAYTAALANTPLADAPAKAGAWFDEALRLALGQASKAGQQCAEQGGSGPAIISPGTWVNPVKGTVASVFGPRTHPITGRPSNHTGEDVAAPMGTPLHAVADGKVVYAGWLDDVYGGEVAIDHGNNITSHYRHQNPDQIKVEKGDTVRAGQEVGLVNTQGLSSGPHLHFEIHIKGEPENPTEFLTERGVTLGSSSTRPNKAAGDAQASLEKDTTGEGNGQPTKINSKNAAGEAVTLTGNQITNARKIIGVGQELGLDANHIKTALMTSLVESMLWNYANSTIPGSLELPHDKVGSDQDSVGVFQQRAASGSWGKYQDLMDVEFATRMFYGGTKKPNKDGPRGLLDIANYKDKSPAELAQAVQVSAHPERYGTYEPVASDIMKAVDGTLVSGSANCDTSTAATKDTGVSGEFAESDRDVGPDTGLKPRSIRIKRIVAGKWSKIDTIGGYRPTDPYPDHPEGRAVDVMIPNYSSAAGNKMGTEIAAWAKDNARSLDVEYIIWDQHIWNPQRDDQGWRPMSDRGGDTANHQDHVHITVNKE